MTERYLGRVEFFSDKKKYGFIKPITNDESEEIEDIFFHWSYIQMEGYKILEQGSLVSFEIGENHEGPMAIKIEREHE